MCGSYSKAEADDSEVAAAANFAMLAKEKELRKSDQDARVSLVEIIEALKQVVAGVNYKMKLRVNMNGNEILAEVIVWKKLSDDYDLCSWKKCEPAKKQ